MARQHLESVISQGDGTACWLTSLWIAFHTHGHKHAAIYTYRCTDTIIMLTNCTATANVSPDNSTAANNRKMHSVVWFFWGIPLSMPESELAEASYGLPTSLGPTSTFFLEPFSWKEKESLHVGIWKKKHKREKDTNNIDQLTHYSSCSFQRKIFVCALISEWKKMPLWSPHPL